jgi:hypothetical protein
LRPPRASFSAFGHLSPVEHLRTRERACRRRAWRREQPAAHGARRRFGGGDKRGEALRAASPPARSRPRVRRRRGHASAEPTRFDAAPAEPPPASPPMPSALPPQDTRPVPPRRRRLSFRAFLREFPRKFSANFCQQFTRRGDGSSLISPRSSAQTASAQRGFEVTKRACGWGQEAWRWAAGIGGIAARRVFVLRLSVPRGSPLRRAIEEAEGASFRASPSHCA